jgi:hypothetical protein
LYRRAALRRFVPHTSPCGDLFRTRRIAASLSAQMTTARIFVSHTPSRIPGMQRSLNEVALDFFAYSRAFAYTVKVYHRFYPRK